MGIGQVVQYIVPRTCCNDVLLNTGPIRGYRLINISAKLRLRV